MPEKNLSQIPRAWREQYEKGLTAFQRQNFDYAITIFTQLLEQEPGFFECRQALRATQVKKSAGGTSFFRKVLSGASTSPLVAKGQLALRSNPVEALSVAEQILTADPNSSAGHKLLAEAAMACELPKTAILSLEILTRNSPNDEDIARKLAQAYSAAGQGAKAERIYTELIQNNPNDPSLNEEFKNLSAQKTLSEGGYETLASGTGSYRDILKDKDQAVALEQEKRQVKTEDVAQRLIAEYEQRLVSEPGNLKLLRSLAELYTQKKDFDRALAYYCQLTASDQGADATVHKAIAETTLKKFDHQLAQLDENAPDYADQCNRIKAERDNFLLEEIKQRAERYPSDLQIRFELGQAFFQAGKISEAIGEFQKAQNNPHRRLQSLSYLGQCFARRNMNDLAARTLQTALKEKLTFDEEKKELIYTLGAVYEKMGKKEEAIEQFKQIYEVDIGFKDVAAKVDAYYGGS